MGGGRGWGLPAFPACGHVLGFNQTKVNIRTVKTGDVKFDGEEEKEKKKDNSNNVDADNVDNNGLIKMITSMILIILFFSFYVFPSSFFHGLVDLVVRRPPRERKIPSSNPACARTFFGVESYQ